MDGRAETGEPIDSDGDGYSVSDGDCNDGDVNVNPGATETCNNVDDDCLGGIDDNLTQTTTCGVGACTGTTGIETCTAGTWGGDTCDPLAGATPEVCDGTVDEGCTG